MVAINRFGTDTQAELDLVRDLSLEAGAYGAVVANHWAKGGEGATGTFSFLALTRSTLPNTFLFIYFL